MGNWLELTIAFFNVCYRYYLNINQWTVNIKILIVRLSHTNSLLRERFCSCLVKNLRTKMGCIASCIGSTCGCIKDTLCCACSWVNRSLILVIKEGWSHFWVVLDQIKEFAQKITKKCSFLVYWVPFGVFYAAYWLPLSY